MAIVQLPIDNIEQSISKPIVMQVLEKIKRDVFFDRRAEIVYIDHTGSAMEIGSTLTDKNQNDLRLEAGSKIVAVSSEKSNNDILLTAVVDTDEMDSIWSDPQVGMYLRPTRNRTEVTIQLTYKAATKQEVNNWIHQYYNRLARGVYFTNAEVAYEVTIPDVSIAIMEEVWKKREAKAGYGEDFLTYLQNNFKQPYDFKSNALGKGTSLVTRELLTHLTVGVNSEVPEASRLDAGNYEATIEVFFTYDKPTTFLHRYPIYVHNNYIDPKFFNHKNDRNSENRQVTRATSGLFANLMSLYSKQKTDLYSKTGYVIPAFDDAVLENGNLAIAPVAQVQLAVDVDDPHLLADLNILELEAKLELHPELLKYIESVGSDIFIHGRSAVLISVYRDGVRINPERYFVDGNLQLRSDYPLNLRGRYHLSISIITNMHLLNVETVEHLSNYGDLAISIIKFLKPDIADKDLPVLTTPDAEPGLEPTKVSVSSLYHAIEVLPRTPISPRNTWFLVNTIAIQI